jgi:virulence-associated protein VapD
MSQFEKLLAALMCGTKDKAFLFSDLQAILTRLGFQCRIKGDHYIYTRNEVDEIINIQPVGNKAKPYQVKQVRNIVLKYHFGGDIDEI